MRFRPHLTHILRPRGAFGDLSGRGSAGYPRRMDPGGHRLRPIATAAEVCLRCGSTDPATLAPDCAHPRVARFVDLRPELADLVIRVHRARAYLAHAVAELGAAADLERLAGRAIVDEEPDALPPPAGVVYLRPRDERVRATSGGEAYATRPLGDLPICEIAGDTRAPMPPWDSKTSESSARQRGTLGDFAIAGEDHPEVAPQSTAQTSAAPSRGTGRRRRATPAAQPSLFGPTPARPPSKGRRL